MKSSLSIRLIFLLAFGTTLTFGQKLTSPEEVSSALKTLSDEIGVIRSQLQVKNDEINKLGKTSINLLTEITRTQQSIIDLENRKKNEKNESIINAYDADIKKLSDQLNSLQSQFNVATRLEGEIQDLNRQVDSKSAALKLLMDTQEYQKMISGLQETLKGKDETSKENARRREEEIKKANEQIEKNRRQRIDYLKEEISLLRGNVEGWTSMSDKYELLASSAESLLLFDEKTNKKIWRAIKNSSLDAGVILLGILSYDNYQQGNKGESFWLASGGIALKFVPSLFKNKSTQEAFEAIARNVSFYDQIIAFKKIGSIMNVKSKTLYKSTEQKNYLPNEGDLILYRDIISLLTEIQFQNLELRNRAEFLLDLSKKNEHQMSDKGRGYLELIIKLYDDSVNNQKTLTTLFTNRYDLLWTALISGEFTSLQN